MQDKLNKLNELLRRVCKSDKQYAFAAEILGEIVKEINILSRKVELLTEKQYPKYFETITKLTKFAQVFGLSEVDVVLYTNDFLNFTIKAKKELKKEITVTQLRNFKDLYINFSVNNGREPQNLNELKEFDAYLRK